MFDSIFYNGEEYKQIWLDGVLVWEKASGEIVYTINWDVPTEPTLPSWIVEYKQHEPTNTWYHLGSNNYNSKKYGYGLYGDVYDSSTYIIYQVTAPCSGIMEIEYCIHELDKFIIYKGATTSFTSDNIIISGGTTGTDTTVRVPVSSGEFYLEFYLKGWYASSSVSIRHISFIQAKVSSIELSTDADVNNIMGDFTISPTIVSDVDLPLNDLVDVIYDSTYLATKDNVTFCLLDGCQGKTLDITYRSKSDSKISQTMTITINADLEIIMPTLIDYTQSTAPATPYWYEEMPLPPTYQYSSFAHGTYMGDSSIYGLVNNQTSWSCHKVVAPVSGELNITYRANIYDSKYPFTIHVTSDSTQPSYSDATGRIVNAISDVRVDTTTTINVVKGETYYIHYKFSNYANQTSYGGCIRTIELLPSIESIIDLTCSEDVTNISSETFTIKPTIKPSNYDTKDLEIIYDSNYMTINPTTFKITLYNGSQGMSHTVTYRSKADNSIGKSFTFYVSADLEIEEITLIDFTQPTAPTLPKYMTEDGTSTYKFNHGLYTTDVYGLIPNNKGKDNYTAYTRYKYVAPTSGDLTFTYRCYAETNYDYLTVHVDTSTSQPSTISSTKQVFTTKGVSSYQNTDGTASISVVEGTTYYIHIQYYKDNSQASGYDMGCIRKIELVE